jgi:hypothetical protein
MEKSWKKVQKTDGRCNDGASIAANNRVSPETIVFSSALVSRFAANLVQTVKLGRKFPFWQKIIATISRLFKKAVTNVVEN